MESNHRKTRQELILKILTLSHHSFLANDYPEPPPENESLETFPNHSSTKTKYKPKSYKFCIVQIL